MHAIRAKQLVIVPGHPPVQDGAVVFENGRVTAAGPAETVLAGHSGPVEDLGDAMVVPGLVNAHVHLELSHTHERTEGGKGFAAWVRSLLANALDAHSHKALDKAIRQLAGCGTVAVLDITSRHAAPVAEALAEAGIGGALAAEFFGFDRGGELVWPIDRDALPEPFGASVTAAGHAVYSTHPGTLKAAKHWCTERGRLFTMHLAEHPDETEQMLTGGGEFAALLTKTGVLPEYWTPPGCRPVEYADRLGLLDERTLAVHCVQVEDEDIATLAARGTAVCLCPRSNAYIGVGRAPWEKLTAAGVPLCLGTDGLSSNKDLNLWNEALAILQAPEPPDFSELLTWMTTTPARLLGLENMYGTLEPGKVQGYSIVPDGVIHAAVGRGPGA